MQDVSVPPSPLTTSSSFVSFRRGVGILTVTLIYDSLVSWTLLPPAGMPPICTGKGPPSGLETRGSNLLPPTSRLLPLYDVSRHGIDAHALLHNPLNSPLYLIHLALQLQYHPAAVLRDIGAADVRDQIKVPAQPPDDGLLDHLLGEGELHSLLGQRVRSYFRVAGRAPVRSLRASSNDDIVGCTASAGCSHGATASWVLRPAPVMNATTSSCGSTRPSWTSRLKPATTTPPAVSANIPSVSASSRIPSTTSSSLMATACPPDWVMTFRAW